ncbi:carbohydrate kinase family protein [Streptomyces sp. NPDC086080]|uniref:carbohydrate kinase family protein n=1 Tax=Streptomyces sp. NPDC086080 TaxID=3365748 RepID=UPI0037D1FCB0
MSTAKRVLVVGGVNFDVIALADRFPAEHEKLRGMECSVLPGGAASNTAVGLVRQGCSVRLVSAVGDDTAGAICLEVLDALTGSGTGRGSYEHGCRPVIWHRKADADVRGRGPRGQEMLCR